MTEHSPELLRCCSTAVYLAAEEIVAKDISEKLRWAADEIERLTRERDEYARQRNAQCEHDADEIAKLERERDALRAALKRIRDVMGPGRGEPYSARVADRALEDAEK